MTNRTLIALVISLACCAALGAQQADQPTDPAEGLLLPQPTHFTNDGPAGRGGGPVTADLLKKAPADPSSWLHFGGNYASWRHSPIKALTPASLKNLRVAWMLPTRTP